MDIQEHHMKPASRINEIFVSHNRTPSPKSRNVDLRSWRKKIRRNFGLVDPLLGRFWGKVSRG